MPDRGCASVAAGVATAVPDLTTGSAVTIKNLGCFRPGNCPAATSPDGSAAVLVAGGGPTTASPISAVPVLTTIPALGETQPETSAKHTFNPASVLAPFFGEGSHLPSTTPSTRPGEQSNQGSQQGQGGNPAVGANSNFPDTQSKATPSSGGLGAIIAGAFGDHSSSTSIETSGGNASPIVIGSQTLIPGASPIVISGSTYSLAPSASAIVVNGLTSALDKPAVTANPAPVITIGSQPVTLNSAFQYIVQGQTLAAGSSAIVISGSTYSLAPSASAIVVDGKTSLLAAGEMPTAAAPIITVGGQPITQNSASQFIFGSQPLAPGSTAIVVSGTTYSLVPSASAIVVNGVTAVLPAYAPASQTSAVKVSAPVITIGTQPYTASLVSGSEYVVGSQTLVPGAPAITVGGVEVSLALSASDIVVGGTTKAFSAATAVASGTTPSSDPFTGGAKRVGIRLGGQMLGLGLGLIGLILL